jgi:hypothetical protein
MCHIALGEGHRVSVAAFPGRPGSSGACTLAAMVERYLDQIQTATTRASYDETLARLIDIAGGASPWPTWPPSTASDAPPSIHHPRLFLGSPTPSIIAIRCFSIPAMCRSRIAVMSSSRLLKWYCTADLLR